MIWLRISHSRTRPVKCFALKYSKWFSCFRLMDRITQVPWKSNHHKGRRAHCLQLEWLVNIGSSWIDIWCMVDADFHDALFTDWNRNKISKSECVRLKENIKIKTEYLILEWRNVVLNKRLGGSGKGKFWMFGWFDNRYNHANFCFFNFCMKNWIRDMGHNFATQQSNEVYFH